MSTRLFLSLLARGRNVFRDILIRVDWKFFTSSGISRFFPVTSTSSGGCFVFFTFNGRTVSSAFFVSLGLGFAVVVDTFVVVVVVAAVVVSGSLIFTDSFFRNIGSSSTVGSFLGADVCLGGTVVVSGFSVVIVGTTVVVDGVAVVTTVSCSWWNVNGPVVKPSWAYKPRISGWRDTATIPPATATNSKVTVLCPVGAFAGFSLDMLSRRNKKDLHGIGEKTQEENILKTENTRTRSDLTERRPSISSFRFAGSERLLFQSVQAFPKTIVPMVILTE